MNPPHAKKRTRENILQSADCGGIIHVANIKGGVGKSTVATNLAAMLSERGTAVLIDLDAQGSATHALGKDPSHYSFSTWELFSRRFRPERTKETGPRSRSFWEVAESHIHGYFPWVYGSGAISDICVPVSGNLWVVPANHLLFNSAGYFRIANFLFNLQVLRRHFSYIILDTPSIWNRLSRALFKTADLNLVPVTLNALSTKSLRDYLLNVTNLSNRDNRIKVRIVKNEVFGSADSKNKGKARTMNENRRFLDTLCEQKIVRSKSGVSFLPQTMLFDLEIPDSAVVRDAQDEGKPVRQIKQYSAVSRAFKDLAQRVQSILNLSDGDNLRRFHERRSIVTMPWFRFSIILAGVSVFVQAPRITEFSAPAPLVPHIIHNPDLKPITALMGPGQSIYKTAKYAICQYTAVVPSPSEINAYILETIAIHNKTRAPGSERLTNPDRIPARTTLDFYPPASIEKREALIPVYSFFMSMVGDETPYVTGDWLERGIGGGRPHYGIDVAGKLGATVISPVSGIAYLSDGVSSGRTVGIVHDNAVIFFSHLDRRYFKSGQEVKKGDAIGTIGLTGRTNGPHVHIGYGIRNKSRQGIQFGRHHYELTDPKLFFYKESFYESRSR